MKLELGSGYAPTPGFVHCDANPTLPFNYDPGASCLRTDPHVDWRCDAAEPLVWRSDSVKEIRAVDVLEHISYRRTAATLREWGRVLAPGGRLFVQVPDVALIIAWLCHDPERLLERIPKDLPQTIWCGFQWRILGGHDDGVAVRAGDNALLNAHLAMFNQSTLEQAVETAGLRVESCVTNMHPNLMLWAVKP